MRRPIILTVFFFAVMYGTAFSQDFPGDSMSDAVCAQESPVVRMINNYGDFDRWTVRKVKESNVIGGKEKLLYEFYGNMDTVICDKEPFVAPEGYLWRTNNVLAIVMGVTKTSTTVFPEPRSGGYCARIETHIENVRALGIVNMEVTCQGALLVGSLTEPIKDTKNPMEKVLYGVPYDGRLKHVTFDYKADVGHETIRGTGFSAMKNMGYPDYPQAIVVLQKRWEEPDGSVKALRVGTAMHMFKENKDEWVNGFRLDVHYGDITGEEFYEEYMGLNNDPERAYHCINSKGKNVIVEEVGWASPDENPNYLIVTFLSSGGKAFFGGVGNTLWVDNVRLNEE